MSKEHIAELLGIVKSYSSYSLYECRETIVKKIYINFFSNTHAVVHSLKEFTEKNEYSTILSWMGHLTNQRAEVFLTTPQHHGDETPLLSQIRTDSEEERISFEFSKWYVVILLRFLSDGDCNVIHQQCIDIISKILTLLKWRNGYYYCSMLTYIIHIAADLVKANDKFYESPSQYSVDMSRINLDLKTLNSSLVSPDKREDGVPQIFTTPFTISVNDVNTCECLQLNVVKIIQLASSDVASVIPKSTCDVTWGAMCCHVELGDLPIKKESLAVINNLIRKAGLPTLDILKYFLSVLVALTDLLCSGCDGVDVSEVTEVEESLSKVILTIIDEDEADHNMNHLTVPHAQNILTQLTSAVSTYQLDRLATTNLKAAMMKLLVHCIDKLSPTLLQGVVLKPVIQSLTSSLIKMLGSTDNCQYLVAPLVTLVLNEMSIAKESPSPAADDPSISTQGTYRSMLMHSKRKRKLDMEEKQKRSKKTKAMRLICVKIESLIGQVDKFITEGEAVNVLEGIQVGLETIVCCYHRIVCQDVGGKNLRYHVTDDMLAFDWWIARPVVQQVVSSCLQTIVLQCYKWPESSIACCLTNILDMCSNFLRLKDFDHFQMDAEILTTLLWILSTPWLPNDPSWMDLKPDNSNEIAKLADQMASKIDLTVKCRLLEGLAHFPKDCSPKWRVHVYRQAFGDSEWSLRQAAVESFPTLLLHLGPNANHLVHDLVSPTVDDKSDEVKLSLARVIGIMACVVCRKAVLRSCTEKKGESFSDSFEIQCLSCDDLKDDQRNSASKSRPNLVDPNMFVPYLILLSSPNKHIKKNTIENLRRIFGHIGVRAKSSTIVNMVDTALDVIVDRDYSVRLCFSKVVPYLAGENCSETNQRIVNKLKDAHHEAVKEQNIRLQETIVLTLSQFGRVAENEQLLVVILNLLESMLSSIPLIAAVAFEQLKSVAQYKKMKTQDLFMRLRLPICRFIAEAMHSKHVSCGDPNPSMDMVRDVAKVLGFPDKKSFLQAANKFLVPHLVSIATPEASILLKKIATEVDVPSRMKIMMDNIKYIFPYIAIYFQEAEQGKAMKFLQKETACDMEQLLRCQFQPTHNELLLHLGTHYQKVFSGLTVLSKCVKVEGEHIPKTMTSAEMADYLQPKLLGVIGFFDLQLLNKNIPLEDKKMTLESLTAMIRLMGRKHIGMIRYKIVNTLRIGLQITDRDFQEISCKAWDCFVKSLDTPFLGQMMSQIIATVLPLLNHLPTQVSQLFNFMIVENRESLSGYFHEVYFLPDIPELAVANDILKQYTVASSSQSDLRTRLKYSMKGITHESLDVRLHALSKLKMLLRDEKEALYQFVIGNETSDPIVSQVVSVLLNGCRDSDSRAQTLYAECIGELGAIDPGRLELTTNDPKADIAKFHPNIKEDNFAFELISQIVKGFLAATETRVQDGTAFALQELLKVYKITDESKIWRRFEDHVKEILSLLMTSKYALICQPDWSKCTKPIFLSEKSKTYAEWVSTWTGYLMSKVRQDHAKSVFASCTVAVKHVVHIALYLLPYAVTQVLLDGTDHDVSEVYTEILEVIRHTQKPDTKHRDGNFIHLSAQTVFSIMDHLTKWRRWRAQTYGGYGGRGGTDDSGYKAVDNFLKKIPQDLLAHACFRCGAHTRALMHFEQFLSSKNANVQDHLDFLQRLYVAMDESDGVIGVSAIRQTQPTLMEQILLHESLGQHQDAQACYEKAIDSEMDSPDHHKGLLQSLMELGQQNKALIHATGAIAERPEWAPLLRSYMVEAAWKLGNWEKLEKCIKFEKSGRNWAVGVGEILLSAKARNEDKFLKSLQIIRREQIGPLSAASMESGSYQRGYQHIVRLHLLTEIEECFRVLTDLNTETSASGDSVRMSPLELLRNWESRLQVMQWSFRAQEPLLTLRRTLFTLAQQMVGQEYENEIGHWWLWSAKIARKEGYVQTAYSSLLQAGEYNLPEMFVEKAKWLWHKGDRDQALTCLERGMSVHFPDIQALKSDPSDQAKTRLKIYAQALLLFGRYSDEASSLESNSILKKYREVIDIYNDWEEGHFYLAQYYDKIMTTLFEENTSKGEFIFFVIKHFGLSLLHGNQYIYQSMPRLLSLWLEYGTQVADYEKQDKQKQQTSQKIQSMRNTLAKLNKLIHTLGRDLAPYQLFTAYPQLISRICHAQGDVFQQLKEIIARIFVSFPQQSLWMMMAVSKSSYPMRVKRCQDIFAEAKSKNSDLKKYIEDGTKLTERLLELCNKESKSAATMSVSQSFRPLKRLLEDSTFSTILVPLQSSMTVTLPNTPGAHRDHNPFPSNEVYIKGLEDTIEILPSLQRPKKITLVGSDGRLYIMMCKPKDDLRKDCRLMEFNGIINKFLHKDPDSRRRQLHIRTYSVIPLNEECGLIEWVNNTSGLRHILMKYYRERGCGMSGKELKEACPHKDSSIETKMRVLKEKLLPKHPPVFKEWFLRTFQDPTSWYNARVSYARTAAVMSMVGYILGLGDRHGENILFDSTNGDCVHVDFNCLFNKGESFEWPERVPFRLTHNMIDAMGPLGYEGIFRKACEVTLRVMRTQMDPLMSVLKPFIYDPLVEWSKPIKPQGQRSMVVPGQRSIQGDTGEINNEQAMTHVQNIEDRLKGILKNTSKQGGPSKPKSVALSIEGHVNHLINESTDDKNQCQMYIGWAAYL